jgi:hypothetical protein
MSSDPTLVTSQHSLVTASVVPLKEDMSFRRFLPDVYLTRAQHVQALDRFFRYFAGWTLRATAHLFYRDMEIALVALATNPDWDMVIGAPNYSPLLHNMVLAIGLAFLDDEHLRALPTRRKFAAWGERHLDREIASPSVASIQALALRSSFASTMGDYQLGWVHQGVANRTCYARELIQSVQNEVVSSHLSRSRYQYRRVRCGRQALARGGSPA